MENYIEEVKKLYKELESISTNANCYSDFKRNLEKMLSVIPESTLDKPFLVNTFDLGYILNDEVEIIKWYQDLKNKKNAPKKRTEDYWNAVDKAKRLIEINISSIINE